MTNQSHTHLDFTEHINMPLKITKQHLFPLDQKSPHNSASPWQWRTTVCVPLSCHLSLGDSYGNASPDVHGRSLQLHQGTAAHMTNTVFHHTDCLLHHHDAWWVKITNTHHDQIWFKQEELYFASNIWPNSFKRLNLTKSSLKLHMEIQSLSNAPQSLEW